MPIIALFFLVRYISDHHNFLSSKSVDEKTNHLPHPLVFKSYKQFLPICPPPPHYISLPFFLLFLRPTHLLPNVPYFFMVLDLTYSFTPVFILLLPFCITVVILLLTLIFPFSSSCSSMPLSFCFPSYLAVFCLISSSYCSCSVFHSIISILLILFLLPLYIFPQ